LERLASTSAGRQSGEKEGEEKEKKASFRKEGLAVAAGAWKIGPDTEKKTKARIRKRGFNI